MSLSSTRETVDKKAHRLVQESRVTWAQGVAVIRGDHETYMVRRQSNTWSCTCPWGVQKPGAKPCSHAIAAALTAPPAPAQDPTAVVDRLLADLKASLAQNTTPAKLHPTSDSPSHVVTTLPRSVRRHLMLVKVTDRDELAALRQVANPTVRYIDQAGVQFAVCEQAVLDSALAVVRGVYR